MNKTKLGISVVSFGALIYFLSMFSGTFPIVFFFIIGYVLLKESDLWLKRVAMKAVIIVVAVMVILQLWGIFGDIADAFRKIAFGSDIVKYNKSSDSFDKFSDVIKTLFTAAKDIVLLLLGIKAFKQGDLPLGAVDKAANKALNIYIPKPVPQQQYQQAPNTQQTFPQQGSVPQGNIPQTNQVQQAQPQQVQQQPVQPENNQQNGSN